jgi:hypothetical protein
MRNEKTTQKRWLCKCAAVNGVLSGKCKDCKQPREQCDVTRPVIDGLLRDLFWRTGKLPLVMALALVVCVDAKAQDYRAWYDAVRQVETGGCADAANAVGDGGRSLGPYQIQRAYWQDSGIPGKWHDVRDLRYAERVIRAYMQRYQRKAWQRGDWQVLSRTHNGGPAGARKRATLGYWNKVKKAMKGGG